METIDLLPQFDHKPALAEPGIHARYCNVGYVLAGLALERVVGESYRTWVTREVFELTPTARRSPQYRVRPATSFSRTAS
jgi:hypothetical protein